MKVKIEAGLYGFFFEIAGGVSKRESEEQTPSWLKGFYMC